MPVCGKMRLKKGLILMKNCKCFSTMIEFRLNSDFTNDLPKSSLFRNYLGNFMSVFNELVEGTTATYCIHLSNFSFFTNLWQVSVLTITFYIYIGLVSEVSVFATQVSIYNTSVDDTSFCIDNKFHYWLQVSVFTTTFCIYGKFLYLQH